ncbi:MAG: MBL fold metallo-hydrolase [Alphaproteobacteria bacterium]|nr:MBL fold metallo-hydrolase [Alphaproteobacteria bacterium]
MVGEVAFNRVLEFEYGVPARLSPLVRRVIAPNPSPFTFHGTGTYIVGRGEVAIIDPGPDLDAHVAALLAAVAGETVTHILITHTHRDHSPAARALRQATGAATYGFGPHGGGAGGDVEEGADRAFAPDRRLGDGAGIAGGGWTLTALHTPGHTSNHLCYALAEERALFPGDHVMGWSTTVVSPPDGDMGAYMASLALCRERAAAGRDRVYYPTHGAPIADPARHVDQLLAHRRHREAQIASCLGAGVVTVPEMVERIYAEVPRELHGAARRSVLAHLVHMVETGRASCEGVPGVGATFAADGPDSRP